MKVTIIIPAHNAGKTIERCIDSIVTQDYNEVECIVVENGSTDNTLEECRRLAARYPSIRLYSNDVLGVSAARNIGLDMATGEIVGFCDADDYMPTESLAFVMREFQSDPSLDGLIGAFYEESESRTRIYRGKKKNKILKASTALSLTVCDDNVMGSSWNKYYRRELVSGIRFDTSLSYCEDMHFNARVLSAHRDARIKLIDAPIYVYADNGSSATHQLERLFDENDELKYIVAMDAIQRDCQLDASEKSYVRYKIACFAIDFYRGYQMSSKNIEEKLMRRIKDNYWCVWRHLTTNRIKGNVKRVIFGAEAIIEQR